VIHHLPSIHPPHLHSKQNKTLLALTADQILHRIPLQ